jgi:hypothetical protein
MIVSGKVSLKDIEGPYEFRCACQDIYGPFGFPSLSLSPRCSLLFEIQLRCLDHSAGALPPPSFEDALKIAEEIKAAGNLLITAKEPNFAEARVTYLRALELLEPFSRLLSTPRHQDWNLLLILLNL